MTAAFPSVNAVVIGRNEGARLGVCLTSLTGQVRQVIYVDSGSTDGSVEMATRMGAQCVALDMSRPFTAARARNAGLAALGPEIGGFVQFIDGDCALRDGWIDTARAFLIAHPDVAVVCGRRRERFPEASLYNRLCDDEWNTPVGEAKACGGDALMRRDALLQVGGYRDDLIAGEEPELCLRLRQKGWKIWRLDAEMTWHDAAITRVAQWFKRARRAGHAFAEGAALHGAPPERHWVKETRRAVFWGVALPAAIITASIFISSVFLWLYALYPLQIARQAWRVGTDEPTLWRWQKACFLTLTKPAEALGVWDYWRGQILRRKTKLIEYK